MIDIHFSPVHDKPAASRLTNLVFLCVVVLLLLSVMLTLVSTASASVSPQVSGGGSHSLALKSDGTVWAWGWNSNGQLGDDSYANRMTPVQVSGLSGIIAISSGSEHSIALKSDGTVWTWGWNENGQMGDGTYANNRSSPIQVSGLTGAIAIAGGHKHTIALKSDGTVWAWGYNGVGQLGDGSHDSRNTPVQVSKLKDVTAIATGRYHTIALKSDGTVWAWGWNDYGQLGDGTYVSRSTPVEVSAFIDVAAIAAGDDHTIALKSDGTVWTWGENLYGQLADDMNKYTKRNTPAQVNGLDDIVAIDGGMYHTIVLKSDGTVWTWGYNSYGQLGRVTVDADSRIIPGQVNSLSNITAIAAGGVHNLALKSNGTIWAWGYNRNGELGSGTPGSGEYPVQVKNLNLMTDNASTPTPTSAVTPTPAPTLVPLPTQIPTPTKVPSPTAVPTKTPVPKGSGIVFGFVQDVDANPLRKVTVTVAGNGFLESTDTNEEGYYEFGDLVTGDYTLTYEKDGYQTQTKTINLGEGEELEIEEIALEEIVKGTIYGYVVNIEGEPVEYVRLRLKGLRTKIFKNESSDKDGFFEFTGLEADTYIITTKRKAYRKDKKTVRLEDGESTEIEIELRKTSRRDTIAIKH